MNPHQHPARGGVSRRNLLFGAAAGVGLGATGAAGRSSAHPDPAGTPVAALVGLLADPLGVTSTSPRLWWRVPVLPGPDGGIQHGYEIQLTRDPRGFVRGAPVESTGRVHSAQSTAVAWPFAPLAARGCAWWRVRTFQGQAQGQGQGQEQGRGRGRPTGWSCPQRIVTGPAPDDWAEARSLWAPPAPPAPGDVTLRATVTIRDLRAGIMLRTAEDLRNGYLWQLTAPTATAGSLLRPHVLVNGAFTLLGEVPLPVPLTAGTPFELTVDCRGNTITTTVDGQLVDSRVDTRFGTGAFGVRTGNSESFWVDDVTVTAADGRVLLATGFDTPADIPSYGTADNGRLLVSRATLGLLGTPGPDHWALLRTEFDLPAGTVVQAVLHAAAESTDGARQFVYRAWCNGRHLGVGPTRSADTPRYTSHDLTGVLRAGAGNALAFQCWTRTGKRLQALLDVHYADGRRHTVVSDGAWRARRGGDWLPWAGDLSTPYYSAPDEPYDARREPVGWREPGYRGEDFGEPLVGTPLAGLVPAGTVAVVQRVGTPVTVERIAAGRWLVDAGREFVGGLRLTLDAPAEAAGATVRVLLGEERNPDGSVRYQLRAQTSYDERWSLRAGPQVIEHWGYRAFRWAEFITSTEIDLSGAVALLEHVAPEPDPVATFTSSSPDLDRVWQLCAYTVRANRQDLFMDTPTRERDAYEGDLLSHARIQMALSASYDLGRHTTRYLVRRPTWPTEYRFMAIAAAWEEYLETGDPDALDADFALHAALQADAQGWLNADGLVEKSPGASSQANGDIVDWPASQRDGYVFSTVNTVVNAWAYQGLRCMHLAAATTGRAAEADRYAALAGTLRDRLNQRCLDPASGAYTDGPTTTHTAQHAAVYAAALGVTEPQQLPTVAGWLAADAGNPVRVSSNAVLWLLEALYLGGRAGDALALMTSRRDASWLSMMEQWGATMTMEAWSPTVKPNTTFSHPWAAGPAAVVARYLLGVRTAGPGAATVEIAPAPADLARAAGTVATVRGPVTVEIEQSPGYRIVVDLPGNTVGRLRWPTRGVPLDGFAIDAGHRPPVAGVDGDLLVVALGPGRTVVTART